MDTALHDYPVYAGSKTKGASEIVARQIDSDPNRKLTIYTSLIIEALYSENVPDELIKATGESILYGRPRVSELAAMDLLRKGGTKLASIHGRTAHVMHASDRVLNMIVAEQPETLDALKRLLRGLIVSRREEIARHSGQNRESRL